MSIDALESTNSFYSIFRKICRQLYWFYWWHTRRFRWVLWLTSFCLGHLKNLPKGQQRFILRHFNFAIQVFTLFSYLLRGNLSLQHLPYMGILILSVSLPAMLGARLFYKISERQFKRIVLGLLFSSGCFLCISYLLNQ